MRALILIEFIVWCKLQLLSALPFVRAFHSSGWAARRRMLEGEGATCLPWTASCDCSMMQAFLRSAPSQHMLGCSPTDVAQLPLQNCYLLEAGYPPE